MSPGRPPIIDQFTDLDISRKRKWQKRKLAAGLCSKCGAEPLINATVGKKCHAKDLRTRKRYLRARAILREYLAGKTAIKLQAARRTLAIRPA